MADKDSQLIVACATLVRYCGAESFGVRYSDDEQPIVWLAVATFPDGRGEADAALKPTDAAWRLCERLVDGGTCVHCGRPAALVEGEDHLMAGLDHLMGGLCEYRYRAGRFRRGCDSLPVGS